MKRLVPVLALCSLAMGAVADSRIVAQSAAAASSSPIATRAALQALERGGTAADAAVAASFALAVDGRDACGLGGGGGILFYDRASGLVSAIELASVTTNDLYVESDEVSAGMVPGFVAGLAALHARQGALEWSEIVGWSAELATRSERSSLAASLESIARNPASFYEGRLAASISDAALRQEVGLTERDLESYRASWVAPIRIDYGPYEVFSLLPPAGGGAALAETLSLLSGFHLPGEVTSAEFAHVLVESVRQAIEDHEELVRARSAAGRVPYDEIFAAERLTRLRGRIDPARAAAHSAVPALSKQQGTSFVVVDAEMNVAVGSLSGCGCDEPVVLGELGFSICRQTERETRRVLLPLFILEAGRPWAALAGSGGFGDFPSVIRMLFGLSRGASIDEVLSWPRLSWDVETGQLAYEAELDGAAAIEPLNRLGHGLVPTRKIGAFNVIHWTEEGIVAISDERETGAAGGK